MKKFMMLTCMLAISLITTAQNRMTVRLATGMVSYLTSEVTSVDIQGHQVRVSVGNSVDVYEGTVENLSFQKPTGTEVNITEARGWLESLYVKFDLLAEAKSYNVYIKGGQYVDYTQVDRQLVRNYGSYGRADVVGLRAADDYAVKVVPVSDNGSEIADRAAEVTGMKVVNYSREGFAFMNGYAPGAYQADGTLKQGAQVIYVTARNARTVKAQLNTGEFTGLQAILAAYEKGNVTTPLAVRVIGTVKADNIDSFGSKEEGIQIKGRKADSELNITIEGIGRDATIHGFGFLVRNSKGVEFRNLGIMRCMDDGLSLDTDNSNIWIHHMDIFYGPNGGGDHAKGDGSIDVKGDSKLVTISYNRLWDTGKSNMFGMKSESGPNYISYDHNWFDHSDSRHPRVRTMSVHVWNNYFDNVAKYGVGATSGSSVFVESNYFLKTKKPILSSQQGTDAEGSGTFSGEPGGMIKAYGNYFDSTCKNFKYYTQKNPGTKGYDAYEAAGRDEQVPSMEVTKVGGTAYDNFDTNASLMYSYQAVNAEEVPALVMGYYGAGRLNHGDFTYTFKDNVGSDNDDSAYDATLGELLDTYQSALVGIFGDEATGGDDGSGEVTPTPEGTITCSFDKSGTPSNSFFTVNGNGSNSKGKATVDGVEYTTCLKMESATSIKFTLTDKRKMTLYFADTETASIKVNGTKISATGSTYSQILEPGSYELTKDKSVNLFYIKLEPVTE